MEFLKAEICCGHIYIRINMTDMSDWQMFTSINSINEEHILRVKPRK